MNSTSDNRNAPSGTIETGPLIVGILGISIPVSLVALACVTGSVIVLILAVLAMFAVGAATLMFMMRLTADPVEDVTARLTPSSSGSPRQLRLSSGRAPDPTTRRS